MRILRFFGVILAALTFVFADMSVAHAQARPAVSVSSFESGGKIQTFFDWTADVSATGRFDGNDYVVSFMTDVPVETLAVEKILPAFPEKLRNWRVTKGDKSTDIRIALPAAYTAEIQKDGYQVTLGLFEGKRPDIQTQNVPVEEKKAQTVPSVVKEIKPEASISETPAAKNENEMSAVTPAAKNDESDVIPVAEDVKEVVPAVSVPQSVEPTPTVVDEKVAQQQKNAVAQKLIDSFTSESVMAPVLDVSSPLGFQDKKETTDEKGFHAPNEGGYRIAMLSFPWPKMTALAAFRRDGYLWLVFDRKASFDFETEKSIYRDIIYEMVQIPHSQATIYRLVTAEGYNPSFRREGLLWVMDLMYQPLRPRATVDLVLQRKTPFGPRLFIPLSETPNVIPILDPEIGDVIFVVPLFSLNKGMLHARTFVDAGFLKTAQGLVIVPKSDEVATFTSNAGLEIRGPQGGMRFSSQDILSFLAKTKVTKDPMAQILDVGVWATAQSGQDYFSGAQELQNEVIKASPEEKPVKRLVLARHYFANGMYPETIGILNVIQNDTPEFFKKEPILALYGAANYMMRRYDEALTAFAAPQLRRNQTIDFWRAATQAEMSKTPSQYLEKLKVNMGVLQTYPAAIKTRLALAGLKAAIARRDELAVQNFIEVAYGSQNINDPHDPEVDFYFAQWQEFLGQYHQAHKIMSRLATGTDYYFRAFAGLEKVRMDAHLKRGTPQERIQELEQLLFAWRDGDFQYNLMTQLVAAYEEEKDYAHVLYLLKDMQLRYRDRPEIKNIPALMEEVFQKLYLNEDSNQNLPPVKAIAIYDEFRDLVPKGDKGVLIARKLADRLTAIDLLDKAAVLLEEQLRHRMSNEDKGLVGTRLGLIYLLNREPERSIKALDKSEVKGMLPQTISQRRYIRAKALKDLGKIDESIALLKNDDSYESIILQAEIYWEAKKWDKAADTFKLLIKRPKLNVPLTDREAQAVLDWATALRLAGRPKVLLRLRENFMPFMKKTPLADTFDFITQAPQKGVMDYKTVPAEVNMAERFTKSFKEHLDVLKKETQLVKEKGNGKNDPSTLPE